MSSIPKGWAEGFKKATGRDPTPADFDAARKRAERARTGEQSSSQADRGLLQGIGGQLGAAGGIYLGSKIPGMIASLGKTGKATKTLVSTGSKALAGKGAGAGVGKSVAAGATKVGAAKGAGAAAGAGAGIGAVALPAAAIAATVYGTYKGLSRAKDKWEGGKKNEAATRAFNAIGSPMSSFIDSDKFHKFGGAAFGNPFATADMLGINLFGGKDPHQQTRDSIRSQFQERGLLDDNFQSASGVDIGKDGGFRFDDGRRVYEHYSGQEQGEEVPEHLQQSIGSLNPLAYIMAGGAEGSRPGYASGMLYNSIAGNEGRALTEDEVRSLYDKQGLDQQSAFESINELHKQGRLTQEQAAAAQNGINQTFGQEYYSPTDPEEIRKMRERIGLQG